MKRIKRDSAWYREWFNSPYYHLLYSERDQEEAADFMNRLLEVLNPKLGSRILDVACGKGRHSIYLASKGFEVTGIDISEESIREALQNSRDLLEFYVHDMRLPFRTNYYDFVFNFFTSFGYFRTTREHDQALQTFAKALKKKGVLVIDYLNVPFVEKQLIPESIIDRGKVRFTIRRWLDATHFYKTIEVIDSDHLTEPLQFTEKVAKFTADDFKKMLAKQGMQIVQFFGTYDLQPFNLQTSPRCIMLAHKTA
jgi:SAM-dependent methyltransferase